MLTTVYVNIPDCRWSASYGCLPQDKSSKLLGTFLWRPPIYSKTHTVRTVSILNMESEPSFALVCGLIPIICSGYTVCVGQLLCDELLCEFQDETGLHTAPSPTLTSNHTMENSGTEGCRNIHTTTVSLRENPGIDKLGLGFSSSAIFYIISFCPVTTPQDQVARAATPAPHHNPHVLIALLTIQACCISYCKTWSLLPLIFLSLPPSTQAKSILPPPDYHVSFTYCCFSIPHTTSY